MTLHSPMFRTSLIAFAANALLWTLQSQLNHYVSLWQMSVFVGGLAVAFAGLRLGYRDGARALILTGLWFDAAAPVPLGTHVFLFLLAQTVIFSFRDRLAREEPLVGITIAAVANLLLFVALSATLLHRNPAPMQLAGRLIADSLISFCTVVVVAGWYFGFVEQLLEIAGVSLRRDQRSIV